VNVFLVFPVTNKQFLFVVSFNDRQIFTECETVLTGNNVVLSSSALITAITGTVLTKPAHATMVMQATSARTALADSCKYRHCFSKYVLLFCVFCRKRLSCADNFCVIASHMTTPLTSSEIFW